MNFKPKIDQQIKINSFRRHCSFENNASVSSAEFQAAIYLSLVAYINSGLKNDSIWLRSSNYKYMYQHVLVNLCLFKNVAAIPKSVTVTARLPIYSSAV